MASYANTTVPGSYVSQGTKSITDLMNRFKDNETVTGLGVGSLFDIGRTQANTGMAVAYNDAFLGSLGRYQSGLENLKFGNASKLMAQEGAIAGDLMRTQGTESRLGIREQGNQDRMNIAATGEQARLGFITQGEQERLTKERETVEEKRLRADARGAVRSQGARFYG
jgi:hypothetical protein